MELIGPAVRHGEQLKEGITAILTNKGVPHQVATLTVAHALMASFDSHHLRTRLCVDALMTDSYALMTDSYAFRR